MILIQRIGEREKENSKSGVGIIHKPLSTCITNFVMSIQRIVEREKENRVGGTEARRFEILVMDDFHIQCFADIDTPGE